MEPRHLIVLTAAAEPAATARRHASDYGLRVLRVYRLALNGYAAQVPEWQVEALRHDPDVRGVVAERILLDSAPVPP